MAVRSYIRRGTRRANTSSVSSWSCRAPQCRGWILCFAKLPKRGHAPGPKWYALPGATRDRVKEGIPLGTWCMPSLGKSGDGNRLADIYGRTSSMRADSRTSWNSYVRGPLPMPMGGTGSPSHAGYSYFNGASPQGSGERCVPGMTRGTRSPDRHWQRAAHPEARNYRPRS